MTREEEYYNYCNKVQYESYNYEGQPNVKDAIKWTDEHPKSPWIKCSERLPNGSVYNPNTFCTKLSGGDYIINYWKDEHWAFHNSNIIAWMPIPKFE